MTQKFSFDTVFSNEGDILQERPSVKHSYTPEEVEAVKLETFAAGRREADGEMAALLQVVGGQMATILSTLIEERTAIRGEAVELAAMISKKLSGALLKQAPEEAVVKLLGDAIDYLRDEPRIVVRVAPELAEALSTRLSEVVAHAGFDGQLVVMPETDLAGANCKIDWAKGGIEHDIGASVEAIDKSIQDFLVAARLVDEMTSNEQANNS